MTRSVVAALAVFTLAAMAACSSDATTAPASTPPTPPTPTVPATTDVPTTDAPTTDARTTDAPTTTVAPGAAFDPAAVGAVTINDPAADGNGAIVLGAGGLDLSAVGYVETEFFVTGTASAFATTVPLSSDGEWRVEPTEPTSYTTRVVVRRPANPARASGNVAVEWLNVSAGFDSAPDWSYSHTELIREGWTWVGVSAQEVGIVGRDGAIVPLALQLADPVRYAALAHPGDSYSYDMFSQVGAAVRTQWEQLLDGIEPAHVFAFGESQSAFRLVTYIDAVAPLANVYDGYLVHSRSASAAPLSQAPLADASAPDPVLVREDLTVPVLQFISETDLFGQGLGYARARQPDTDLIRTWEVGGTAHADLYNLGLGDADDGSGLADDALFAAMSDPPNQIYGGVITCDLPINTGPHTYVLRSAISALAAWVETGEPPPSMPRIELDANGALAVDDLGNALGGIRTPQIDVPIATLSGLGQTGAGFCGLFGTTTPFDAARLATLYPAGDSFAVAWVEAVDRAVGSGAVLEADAVQLRRIGMAN